MPRDSLTHDFGPVVYSYTRAQALADGEQVDVTETAREAGITFPVYMTRAAWGRFVEVPAGAECQDERVRLWDVVSMLRHAIRKHPGGPRLTFALYVNNGGRCARLETLRALCGPQDIDNPAPAITITCIDED